MQRSTKEAWLSGPGDLHEAEVEDVPTKGFSVKVRALPAAYSNQAVSEAVEVKTTGNGQAMVTTNKAKLELLQFVHGVTEPVFNLDEAKAISEKYAEAWRRVIDKIDEISAIDKEEIEAANARFRDGVSGEEGSAVEAGASNGSGGSDVPARTGVGTEDAGG